MRVILILQEKKNEKKNLIKENDALNWLIKAEWNELFLIIYYNNNILI